ncbi:OLC1v1036690C1 [Oldenlandia corymbosa var. corymbosa]|uniref:OLC1v1036690C1 n=1 Tax=Oldenlandia corymbosa var. corymbosa TaxID=529605 RepID=A0AAV1CWT4_OLDCO|nr:OLC1v1036690C1 [Oldenlandia corymbosa var. corymbosa]
MAGKSVSILPKTHYQHEMILHQDEEASSSSTSRSRLNFECNYCKFRICSNEYYRCTGCSTFRLHKSCKEIPYVVKGHPSLPDPNSELFLCELEQHPNRQCFCCKQPLVGMLFYSDYEHANLDMVCALAPKGFTIQHESHPQHPLIPMTREVSFTCNACGTSHPGHPLVCQLCWFSIDRGCARLTTTFSLDVLHEHRLHLAYSLPEEYNRLKGGMLTCEICRDKINPELWVYHCKACRYFAHTRCATFDTEPFMSIIYPVRSKVESLDDVIRLPVESEFVDLVSHLRRGLEPYAQDNSPHGFRPNRDVHCGHPLILHDQAARDGSKSSLCDGCIQPISPPYFSCADSKCNFFLHKRCIELPDRLVPSPFRTLNAISGASFSWELDCSFLQGSFSGKSDGVLDSSSFDIFQCHGCQRPCNGLSYKVFFHGVPSRYGKELYDVKCALLPAHIVHDSHPQHRLELSKRRYAPCPCCLLAGEDQGEYIYRCLTCSFNLHQKCALYPSTIRHRYDKHPLHLTYKPIQGRRHLSDDDEYYCEICELEVNQHGWFYHCVQCDQSFHITCMHSLDSLSNIKFGQSLTLSSHCHPLILERMFVGSRACEYCNDSIKEGMAFECKQCVRYQIHFECAKSCFLKQGGELGPPNSEFRDQREQYIPKEVLSRWKKIIQVLDDPLYLTL